MRHSSHRITSFVLVNETLKKGIRETNNLIYGFLGFTLKLWRASEFDGWDGTRLSLSSESLSPLALLARPPTRCSQVSPQKLRSSSGRVDTWWWTRLCRRLKTLQPKMEIIYARSAFRIRRRRRGLAARQRERLGGSEKRRPFFHTHFV